MLRPTVKQWNTYHPKDPVKSTTREMKRPELEFQYDLEFTLRAMLRRRATGVTPSPDEIAAIDDDWEDELDRMEHWFDFERRPGK